MPTAAPTLAEIAVEVTNTVEGVTPDACANAVLVDAFIAMVAASIPGIEPDMVINVRCNGEPVARRRLTEHAEFTNFTYDIFTAAALAKLYGYDNVTALALGVESSLEAAAPTFVAKMKTEVAAVAEAAPAGAWPTPST